MGDPLTGHPKVRMVSLTGSIATGAHIIGHTASSIKRTHMELGGKAPVIVFDDADIDAVVEGVRTFGFYNAGRIVPLPVAFMPSRGSTIGWWRNWARPWLR
ncbi:Gamma-aminobutyraldehyde dehydrogenase [Raoultella planticola]|uniref:Gamma-aminobutyraldehyde dehydrogenase n=1 Tax=Raoultella planticola TaxID=575 RepID=A0A485AVN0_RAOPL|nr:Gamma-aminobutyraldehyde dehydrogenase [Raoultella planticola]